MTAGLSAAGRGGGLKYASGLSKLWPNVATVLLMLASF